MIAAITCATIARAVVSIVGFVISRQQIELLSDIIVSIILFIR